MKEKYKKYLKLNLVPLFFISVSFISITLAWFAYSGIANVNTEIDVKAWYIEFQKDNVPVSNDIVVSLSEIYPGMEPVNEIVNIKNPGDSDAQLKYSIQSVRILDDEEFIETQELSNKIEDQLSHDYPFHLNINLNKNYIVSKGDDSVLSVSVSWPLDSDTDAQDSEWGNKAYQFSKREEEKLNKNSEYQVRTSVKVVINVTAEQYIETTESPDMEFNLGDSVLFDVMSNRLCSSISDTCIKMYILDKNSMLKDSTVTLLPDLIRTYPTANATNYSATFNSLTGSWQANTRELTAQDILKVIENDVNNSILVRESISDSIIGNLNYNDRMLTEINKAINYNGYYNYKNYSFSFLEASKCIWTASSYNSTSSFALNKVDEINSKLYSENNNSLCSVVPIVIAPKSNLK